MEVDENNNSIGSIDGSVEDITEAEKCCSKTKRLIADQGSGRCMSTQAMQSLYDLRQNNLLCDAVIRLEDGGVFPIHRAILSACSTYFRTLFTTTLHSKEKTDFLLPNVSSKIMNLLLEYAYLRTLEIRQDNVCQLLQSADYLNIPGVLELCCDYLRLNLTPENCIGIMLFAREYFCRNLEIDARRYILRNFVQVRGCVRKVDVE